MEKEILGNFIAESRKELEMTQQTLADKLHVTNAAVSKWERGLSYPDLALLEPLAAALKMTVSELMACRRNSDIAPHDNEDTMRSVLDIAHATSKKQRNKIWILAVCSVLCMAILIGLIWGTVRYVQLTSISVNQQVSFFCKDIQDGNYYVYVSDFQDRSNPQLIRLQCPNRVTWENIVADNAKVYSASYTYNSLTLKGSLGDFNESVPTFANPLDLVGTATGLGDLFDISGGSVMRFKRVSMNPGFQGGHLYTIEIFSCKDFYGNEFRGPGAPILTVTDCRGAATYDYDDDGITELFILTKYDNYPCLVYDLADGEIVTQFVDKSLVPPDRLSAWP